VRNWVPIEVRFRDLFAIDPETRCWLWTGWLDRAGYGLVMDDCKKRAAHRVAYELHRGEIPEGLTIDHLCRVPRCVNPDHLEAVTMGENVRRAGPATKTHCKNGHPFNEANTYLRVNRSNGGKRQCRECSRLASAALRAKKWRAA
jgi:hypothetical protein